METASRRSRRTILLCFIVALIEGLDLQSAGIAAAGIRAAFNLDQAMMGWMFSASIIGLLPGAFLGGCIADRVGRKKVLVAAVVLFGIFSLWTAYAGSLNSLLMARFLTGLGLGAALPNLIALCAEAVEERQRSTAISIMYCGVPLGGATAALVAMAAGEAWQWVFIVGGVAPLAIVPLMIAMLPESTAFSRQQQGVAVARPSTLTALCGEGRTRVTLSLWVSYFFTLTVMYMLLNWLPSLLLELGFSKPQAGVVQMAFNIGGAIGSLAGGVLLDRYSRRLVVLCIYGGLLLALAGIGLADNLSAMIAAGFAAGGFVMAAQLVLYALAPAFYPTLVRATGVGAAVAIGRLGSVTGPLAAGKILAAGAGTAGVLTAAAPGLLVAAAVILALNAGANRSLASA
ncbi:3-(3-hydroxy-phenyl)propionate transporter MhpT [Pseudomonas sp. JM0905a]|uniref:3-(3-hydroxy-phenyl)propionate transporter MhpT n=1 Tax=Metapseudomonas resinovorans TaxID=53412 RepID=A0ABT4XY80_METRE|nr:MULTISPECIES: 3-(3-hydroxy-phenyl)propionate transporter MhpT [Pseudomonas]MBD2837191.1 3-(3-hydroxy-phenyl)propionate transporter MhpT [Pseudomonas sp. JM0905a]MDA8481534.1 3-(3-hydroxy-phenyl)propionate transporter MhpT [Pseudomonas resinovorans]